MQQIADWLKQLGMHEYIQCFTENDINLAILGDLTDQDLKEIGVASLGHRRKLLRAIANLKGVEKSAPAVAVAAAPSATPPVADTAERRQVTVIFSDLVGSTALSGRMDPEDLREVISAYQKCVAEVVRRFGGFVAKYLGDGVLVYFGYPEAHEDDAERAVRAGLELIAAASALKTRASLQSRVGIATGIVVVGDLVGSGSAQEQAIVGETPNLAARLQGIAEPNSVVIAESTQRLLGNLFELQDLETKILKGIAEPVRAFVASRPSSVESRFEALHAGGLTALVGREEELELMLRRWSRAKSGDGQVVLLSGEAGIGKSRLIAALLESIASELHTRLRYFCSPQHTDSALYPIIGQMERAAGLAHEDTSNARLDKLDALLAQTSTSIEDTALFAEMLSLPNDGRYPTLELTPQQRRQKTLDALIAQMGALSCSNPLLMIFEDVHWSDPTSLELFGRAVEQIANHHVLLIVTFRPEFQAPWIGRPHVTALTINRLAQRDVNAMIDGVVGNKLIPANIRQDIIERTDGIPLFVEEMTKAVLETENEGEAQNTAAAVPSPTLAVPASLHASLMARLDRLGPAKETAQIGAAIGRKFSHALMAAVVQKPEAELNSTLDRLIAAGLLFRQGVPPHASYLFKHALVRDAAYGTLLREPRRALNVRIAEALESQFAEIAHNQPELLARHYSEAGMSDQAVKYWHRAGERAVRRSANQEAINHLNAALTNLAHLSDTQERVRRELEIQQLLGQASLAARGTASQETARAFNRARELCAMIGDDVGIRPVLMGVWLFELAAANHANAEKTANDLLALADRTDNTGVRITANMAAGVTGVHLGTLARARLHFEKGIELYRRLTDEEARALVFESGVELGIVIYLHAAWCFWLLGYPDQALGLADEALAISERIKHDYTRSRGLYWNSVLHAYRREWPIVEARAATAVALGQERGLALVVAGGRLMHASAKAMLEPRSENIAEIQEAMAAYSATGAVYQRTYHLVLLAEALSACGGYGDGLSALEEAEVLVEQTGERYFEAEISRLRGNLLLARAANGSAAAEACYLKALETARSQEARSLELRAATILARLWRDQGKRNEARDLLVPIYGWFTEGFDTLDLKEAKALLSELHA